MSRKHSLLPLRFFIILTLSLIAIAGFAWSFRGLVTWAASPSSGTVSPSSPNVAYSGGPFNGLNQTNQADSAAIVCTAATPCDDYALAVNIPSGDPNTYSFTVRVSWTSKPANLGNNDFDLYVYDSQGKVVQSSASSANPEVASVTVKDSSYKIRVLPFDVNTGPNGDTYNATVTLAVVPGAPPIPPPGPTVPGDPRYQNYAAPNGLGTTAGEPSIGVDWPTGKVFIGSNTQTLRVTFDDCSSPAKSTWEDKSAPTSATSLDPILFTDHNGLAKDRTFVSQLTGQDSLTSFTDDDGDNWTPSQGGGVPSGVDHQTLGGGPYRSDPAAVPPVVPPPHPTYPNAIYYCSQEAATAFCARSDNGGQTFGPGVPTWTIAQCSGIHGHVKVAPDGTVYVPNKSCGGKQGFAMSRNNGVTWTVVTPPDPTPNTATSKLVDPSIGIGKKGTVYFAYEGGADGSNSFPPRVAVAKVAANGTVTWSNDQLLGAEFGIKNAVFPAAISSAFNPSAMDSDDNRAAVAFLGTTASGDYTNTSFKGTWHLFISTTFDGGVTWKTIDATPNDPVQRGSICTLGTTDCDHVPDDRNLLDFMDVTIDRQGRVLVGYPDGCIGGCVNGTDNSFTALASIARQSGGKRLISAFDPVEPGLPGAPLVTAVSDATGIHLSWPEPDNGGSPITNYKVYRRPENGQRSLLANIGVALNFDDLTADPNVKYFYSVSAVNAIGEGPVCGEVSAVALPKVDSCTLPGVLLLTDPTGDGAPPTPALDIEKLSVAEPFDAANPNASKLTWTMKVASGTATPNSQWYIIWDFGNGLRRYVAMLTDASGTPSFRYGHIGPPLSPTSPDPGANKPFDDGAADSGSIAADGTIRITISNSKVFECVATDSTFATCSPSSNAPKAGNTLANISPRTFSGSGTTNVTGSSATDSTANTPAYTLVSNFFCRPNNAPIPRLTASPTFGPAPLTVNFDATTSSDPDVGDAIAAYIFDFGDTFIIQQSSPIIAHVYNANGTYQVKLYVRDTRGKLSVSPATATITVGGSPPPVNTAQFSAANYNADEGAGSVTISVTRSGDTSVAASVSFATSDAAGSQNCNVVNSAAASERCDYETLLTTVKFTPGETSKTVSVFIIDDSYLDGTESFTVTLTDPIGMTLGSPSSASVTIMDNDTSPPTSNPIDISSFFIRQLYLDFLGRDPEPSCLPGQCGFDFYLPILNGCGADIECLKYTRGALAANFFRAPEFGQRGGYVANLFNVVIGQRPKTVAELSDSTKVERPHYREFMADLGYLSASTDAETNIRKDQLAAAWLARTEVQPILPGSLTNQQFVQKLETTAGVTLANESTLIANLNNSTQTRAQVLRAVAESPEVFNKFFKQNFVMMMYVGHLRREPENCHLSSDPANCGYIFHNNRFNVAIDPDLIENFISRGFIESPEYRKRFGP
jgi:PKD repeat protein